MGYEEPTTKALTRATADFVPSAPTYGKANI